jgi:hypothetical protein
MPPDALTARRIRRRLARLAGVVALGLLAFASTADALELVSPSGDPRVARYQGWADAAATPTPTGVVDLVFASCPVPISDGCITYGAPPTIFLGSAVRDRPILMHELGHAFDAQRMTPADRAAFEAIFADRRQWRAAPNSPHERFAEAYSLCARHARIRRAYTGAYGYRVTPRRHRRVCALIDRAGSAATSAVATAPVLGGWE